MKPASEQVRNAAAAGSETPRFGFRRPPNQDRFRKRQSGNPIGARRQPGDLGTLFGAALDAPTILVEGGRRRRVTRRELIAARLADRSAQARLRVTRLLVDLVTTIAPRTPEPLDATEKKIVDAFLARLGMAE
jgi:Family of unknown function (DUF5681)